MKIIENDNFDDFDLNNNDTAKEENGSIEETGTGYFESFGKNIVEEATESSDYTDISSDTRTESEETAEYFPEEYADTEYFPDEYTDTEYSQEEASASEYAEAGEEKMNFFVSLYKNERKRAKLGYALVAVVLIIVGTVYGFINAMFDKLGTPDDVDSPLYHWGLPEVEPTYAEEDYALFAAISAASSLNDYISQWYDSGEKMSSKNVINVMLFGLDSYKGLQKGGRSDTMMLVSLNTKTKKIKMISFFRDTWAKFYSASGKEFYGKMNGAYYYGGAKAAVETIENMFKIKIDHYVTVDFTGFKDIVDAVGGVRVDVLDYEAANIKREWDVYCPVGENVLLNGEQAFWFARQRHSNADADVSRTRRQRQVIKAFIESCKGASLPQLTDALNQVFGFVRTDLVKSEITNYAARALAYGWVNYEIENVTLSDYEIFRTPKINGLSIVVQDYPKVAQIVQNAIYGNTNVVLEDDRVIVFNLYS